MDTKKFYLKEEYVSYVLVLIFGLIVFLFIQDPNESFFVNYDQEFWNTYNSLLIYSGLEQEKYDEPGHVTYLLFSFYLKIINFLNIVEVPKISQLNKIDNVNDIVQSLIFHTRIFGFIINILLTLSIIKIFKKFKAENLIFITLILITSNGFLTHVSQHRVEPLTILMMMIAFFSLLTLLDNNDYKILKIFLFNFFIILSIINKVQIIFYLPFFILIILQYKNLNFNLFQNIKFISKNKKDLFYFISSTFFVIFLIFLRSEQLHSSAYLTIMYLLFLISFFCIFDMNNYKNFSYLFNLSLIFAFLTIYVLVLYFTNGGDRTFWVFFKISKIRGYLSDIKLDQSKDTILWIKNFLEFGIFNLKQLIINIFEFQKNNLVIFIIVLLTIISKNFKNLWSLNIFIALYLITKFITLFRSNAFYYEIYFDWLILLGLIIFFRDYFIKSYLKYLILLIIIAPNIYNNLNAKNFNEINSGSYDKQTYCSNDQIDSENGIWKYYSKKIEKKQILILCK